MQSMKQNWNSSYLFGANSDFIEELYELYLEDTTNVDPKWKQYFDSLQDSAAKDVNHSDIKEKFTILTSNPLALATSGGADGVLSSGQTKVYGLIASYRAWGHKFSKLDPLERQVLERPAELDVKTYGLENELDNEFFDDYDLRRAKKLKLKEIIAKYDQIYCGSSGFEFAFISDLEEQEWLRNYVETQYLNYQLNSADKKQILLKLTEAEGLEKYLHTKYVGQKRFSLEGGDTLIPILDRMINQAAEHGVDDIYLGMAHRGRLNTLVNITGKAPQKLFDEFDGNYPSYDFVTSGDVKYHKGYACEYVTQNGKKVKMAMAYNPSHLEVVNPVVQGVVRAKQDRRGTNKNAVMGVLIHGDSALIGLGTNQAVFNMSHTRTYGGYGLIHIVVNNQVGFTTSRVSDNRSSRYCTDIAKMIESPVIHVNGDDLRAVAFATDLSVAYRQKFERDIVIDMVCFRRHGHNEADDPTLTQPLMYAKVKQHPGIRALYAAQLVNDGVIAAGEDSALVEAYRAGLQKGEHINSAKMIPSPRYDFDVKPFMNAKWDDKVNTKVSKKKLAELAQKVTTKPTDASFKLHPTIVKLIDSRVAMGAGTQPIDFGMAETLAYAALLDDGISIRLSGEDASRGTFSHRHAAWHNMNRKQLSEGIHIPLKNAQNNSWFAVYDSILNEEGVLGFEYGYSLESTKSLTIWEGQFGDFANGAQVMIDQFIVSGEAKWGNLSRLAMILPHGFDGQGPEHSSARIERFLQLAAEDNIIAVIPSTAAQMFHMIRRQAKSNFAKPLVIFLSKRLLRAKEAMSDLNSITDGVFLPVIADDSAKKTANRVIFCTGQVYYDLLKARAEKNLADSVAIVRVEQLYPFPAEQVKAEVAKYAKAKDFVWAQEEPYNQGAWLQIREDLDEALGGKAHFKAASRPRAAAPACGTSTMHNQQLADLLAAALTK
ncbi:MAG: 2-oxoglutarate dehydrogenase E1 component [Burkholderiales bacterium]|jgi:2-oxoglutarate dehydrogenase E1 component|nr:2-oxoglutarate dehydrogenase E1 component [Burkholderiales bacterium]